MVKEEKQVVKKAPAKKQPAEAKYEKDQLVNAKQFTLGEKSFLEVLLKDDETYTIKEAQEALSAQLKRKVDK